MIDFKSPIKDELFPANLFELTFKGGTNYEEGKRPDFDKLKFLASSYDITGDTAYITFVIDSTDTMNAIRGVNWITLTHFNKKADQSVILIDSKAQYCGISTLTGSWTNTKLLEVSVEYRILDKKNIG